MTREFLLKAAITEFKDLKNKVIKIPFKRVYTDEGYCYLVLDRLNAVEIECALHINTEYVITEEIGQLHTISLDFSTREKFDIPNTLFVYKGMDANPKESYIGKDKCEFSVNDDDLIFFAKSYEGYNETMKQYMYSAEGLTIDKKGLLEPIHDVYGYSSFDIISQMPNYEILPMYANIETRIKQGVILLSVQDAEPMSMMGYSRVDKAYKQSLFENIEINLVHKSRYEVAKFLDELAQYSLSSKKFGFASTPAITEFPDLQEAAALRGQAVKIALRISYARDINEISKADKLIREVVWKMSDTLTSEIGIFRAK